MFPSFIGINEKFVNLNAIALIEDRSSGDVSVALITTSDGEEIELSGEDATLLFDRAELIAFASDSIFEELQTRFDAANPQAEQEPQ